MAKWVEKAQCRASGNKTIGATQKQEIYVQSLKRLRTSHRNGSLRIFSKKGKILALAGMSPAQHPRVRHQKSLYFFCSDSSKRESLNWFKREIPELCRLAPTNTQILLFPKEDLALGNTFIKAGFRTRYEVLAGKTDIALKNLMKTKQPSRDLLHLGLEIKPITRLRDVDRLISLQSKISRLSRHHTYFAHTKMQLAEDRQEYAKIVRSAKGLILGVYREKTLLGFMMASLHVDPDGKSSGGFSFFLHPTIQGLGISKTGYRLMLEYFKSHKVSEFHGGTSQESIRGLAKVMKRKVRFLIYLKQ